MKLFIASDIHGSAFYLEKMLKAYEKENADMIVLLGDILYHGPRNDLPKDYNPKKVIEKLNLVAKDIICVKGNCDTEVDQMVLDFPIMQETSLIFADGLKIYLNHGHERQTLEKSISNGSVLICGHTHVPLAKEENGYWYLNPGSVSIPKENSEHSYLVYENKTFTWKTLDGEEYNELKL